MNFGFLITMVFATTTILFTQNTRAASDTAFDGTWWVTVDYHAYKNPDGSTALPTAKHFTARVKNGVLHGEVGTRGAADWYELDGKIEADGTAILHTNGITGNPKYTPGHPEPGIPFGYKVTALFDGRHGTGQSVADPPPPRAPRTRIYTFVRD
jgi:hypothetical protein